MESTQSSFLKKADYPDRDRIFLVQGFKPGFDLCYKDAKTVRIRAPNLKIRDEIDLWNKVMKEVKMKRYPGPYYQIPYKTDFIRSPIGLVPKDGGEDVRLIFYLSYQGAKIVYLSVRILQSIFARSKFQMWLMLSGGTASDTFWRFRLHN